MTPNQERPGRFLSPHANVLGRLVPTGSKAEMRKWIDLTNEAQHGGTRKISLERAEEKSLVDRQTWFVLFIYSHSRKNGSRATRSSYTAEVYTKRFIVI